MSAADALRTVCALAQVPGISPSGLALAFSIARETGMTIDTLPLLSDAELGRLLNWSTPKVRSFRDLMDVPADRFLNLVDRGIKVSTPLDLVRPKWVTRLQTTPWLFYGGDLGILDRSTIGFSGSRDAGDRALTIASSIATEAVKQQMAVVSGGARGVDMAAHTAAIAAGGTTVVLIPQGIDTWRVPAPLADPMMQDRVLVLSADLPWAPWATVSAMQRNRAIVDVSDVVTIPQAGTTGGSHSTGEYALARKRVLWVADLGDDVPGNQLLLYRGARSIPMVDGNPDIVAMCDPGVTAPAQQSLF